MTGTNGQAISTNTSGIRPLDYKILVLPQEVNRKTKGGLILADQTVEKEEFGRKEGILVAKSPMAFKNPDWPDNEPTPQVGDRVMFSKYQAEQVQGRDGATYWIMNDKSVLAMIEADE
jgi:co-chaperonin GroES (HSP10)